jgi:precorrin-3B C17-methyltransferase
VDDKKMVTPAVNGGIGFGSKLSSKQLMTLARFLDPESEIELTTFQQLYIQVPNEELEKVIRELEKVGLSCYKTGPYV